MTSIAIAALLPPFVQDKMLLCNLMILRYNFDGNDCSSILNFWQLINVTHDQSFEFWHRTTLFFIKPSFCFLFSFLAFSQCIVSFFCNLWDNQLFGEDINRIALSDLVVNYHHCMTARGSITSPNSWNLPHDYSNCSLNNVQSHAQIF